MSFNSIKMLMKGCIIMEMILKLEERNVELNSSVVIEEKVIEMSCSGRADGSWR